MTSFADPGSGAPAGGDSRDVQVNLNADVSGYTQSLGQAQQQTEALEGSVGKLVTGLGRLTSFAGKKLVQFAAADFAVLGAGVADAASLDHQLGTLRATSVVTGSSMGQMKKELDDAFTRFPMARAQVVQLAEAINSLGVTDPKAVGRGIATFTKLGAATGENSTSLASSSVQLGRQFGNTSPDQLDGYANSLLTVSKNQGVAASGVLDFAQAIAPMARAAGIGEAAVLGISAAFQKAGADGGYAANTFNQIAGDITQLSATGSPELAKYSNFTGKSVAEFRQQSGTEQLTSVFRSIAKGGPEAMSFVTSLGLGQRAVRSVQAVAQSGGLEQAISQAQGSSNDTENLDKASEAALHGLSDSILETGNAFTKLGEMIGEPLLKPITMLVDVFNTGLNLMNKVVDALGPIPTYAAAIAGALAIPAALLVGKAGLVLAAGAARGILGPNSAGRQAFREGQQAGRNMLGPVGMSRDAAMAASGRTGAAMAAGTATMRQSYPYRYGMSLGSNPAAPTAPGGVTGAVARTGIRGAADRVRGAAFGAPTWLMNTQSRGAADGRIADPNDRSAQRLAQTGQRADAGLKQSMREGNAGGLVRATGRMYGESARTIGSAAASVAGTATRAVAPAVAPAAGALARGASAVGGALFSPLTLIASMVAIPVISSIISSNKEKNAARADVTGSLSGAGKYDQALDRSSTNLARFGQNVDAAANRLAGFANTPVDQLTGVTGSDIATATKDDYQIADPALRDVVNQASDSDKSADDTKKSVLAYFQSIGVQAGSLDGASFTKYKQDLVNVMGVSRTGEVENIMGDLADRTSAGGKQLGNPDFGNLADLASGATQTGSDEDLERFKNIFGAGSAGLVAATQNGGEEGQKAQLAGLLSMAAKGTGPANAGQDGRLAAISEYFSKYGVDQGQFQQGIYSAAGVTPEAYAAGNTSPFDNATAALPVLVKAFAGTDQGKALLEQYGMSEADLLKQATNPTIPSQRNTETDSQLSRQGTLGTYAANSSLFESASIGEQSGQAGAGFAAAQQLVGEAAKQAGNDMGKATGDLMVLSDALGGVSTPTGALIKSAADWARQLQSFRTQTFSREGQLAVASQTAAASAAAADPRNNPTSETVAQSKQDTAALEQSKESYRQYMIGRIQQLKQFAVSREREEEDNQRSIFISNRDFETSQLRAEASYNLSRQYQIEDAGTARVRAEYDFNLQVLQGQQDFEKSSRRSLESYQRGVDRQNEDHARDLKRQAEASAQSIYDPFTRIQAKAVTDAGTLIYNLQEQNADIERQMKEIQELKDRGVSQQTVDTLKLGEVDNAQQVSALLRSLEQNPNMTGQINDLITTRVAGAGQLTQSGDNVGFRQGEEDYKRQMARGATDFGIQMDQQATDYETAMTRQAAAFARSEDLAATDTEKSLTRSANAFTLSTTQAVADHQKSLDDMATSLKITQDRAATDLQTSFIQYTGNFTSVMTQLTTVATGAIGTYAPAAAGIVRRELDAIKADNPWLTSPPTAVAIPLTKGQRDDLPTAAPAGASKSSLNFRYATGGISLTQQTALVSEHGPELHLPLNSRGENFMAAIIAKSLAQGVTTAVSGMPTGGSSSSMTDNSVSFAGADIRIEAQDPNAMARQLAAKAKLRRLASPARH